MALANEFDEHIGSTDNQSAQNEGCTGGSTMSSKGENVRLSWK